ncbi:hypothetical protein LIER_26630 [Lithospermum erythrorhizon]|uniref:Uncharacterized protein n=1 Tax=Lithospermum erythrorhizon TaxID=34254 RepID=A0AAV3R9A3_LITER
MGGGQLAHPAGPGAGGTDEPDNLQWCQEEAPGGGRLLGPEAPHGQKHQYGGIAGDCPGSRRATGPPSPDEQQGWLGPQRPSPHGPFSTLDPAGPCPRGSCWLEDRDFVAPTPALPP